MPTSGGDAAAVLSVCLLLDWGAFQVPVVAGVSLLRRGLPHHLHLQPPGDWWEASLPLEGVWKVYPVVRQAEEGWELSSWEAFPCEEGAWHPASAACFGRGKRHFLVFSSMQTVTNRLCAYK